MIPHVDCTKMISKNRFVVADLTILVSSPESYRDVFDIFADLLNKNWSDCPFPKVYATNHIDTDRYKGFQTMLFPEASDWISRTKNALGKITSKYVLIVADDLFFINKVNNFSFSELIDYMEENDSLYCRLYRSASINRKKNSITNNIFKLRYNHAYGRNLLGAIWNKEFFLDFLNETKMNPWEIEEHWLKEALSRKDAFIDKHLYFHNNYFYHAVYKGLWMRDAYKKIVNQKILFRSTRPKLLWSKHISLRVKSFFGNFVSPTARLRIKKALSKFIHFDSKY